MPMKVKYTAVYEELDDGWVAYVEELPGANTQGKTRKEARGNLKDAIRLVIESHRELARRGETDGRKVIREELAVRL